MALMFPGRTGHEEALHTDIADHVQVVENHHRFSGVSYRGEPWDLSHLDAFAIRVDPGLGFEVDVVVLFSCHCFTESLKQGGRAPDTIAECEVFDDGRERRVLCPVRYEYSRKLLRPIIKELPTRTIQVASSQRQNFVTFEERRDDGTLVYRYGVFFEVVRDHRRKKRLLLRVQSAYLQEDLSNRQQGAGKVGFGTLLRAAYTGRQIKR
jgi:hypothetical protein